MRTPRALAAAALGTFANLLALGVVVAAVVAAATGGANGLAFAVSAGVVATAYVAGAWWLKVTEARGVAGVARARIDAQSADRQAAAAAADIFRGLTGGLGVPVPDDLAELLGAVTGEAPPSPDAPPPSRVPPVGFRSHPWQPVSEAAPHVFGGHAPGLGPSGGHVLGGSPNAARRPPNAAPEIPGPRPPGA
jgi:hypothetical protein